MKLNQLLLLGTTSLLLSTVSIYSYAETTENNSVKLNYPQTLLAQTQSDDMMSGAFMAGEKPTTGMAKIVNEGGHYYLELDEAFGTSDEGPDLHVLLDSSEKPMQTYDNLNGFLNLGKLQSYNGTQRYPIPDVVNPEQFKSVVIWCRMANAVFGYAPLQ
jgi:Electron transfer DM13